MTKYNHAEAFCLMWYRCDDCGHRERIWNSRDGVTPFGGMTCTSCGRAGLGGGLRHEAPFSADQPAPDHKLIVGQQFFRDGTAADAISIIKRRIVVFAERGHPIPELTAERLLNDARNLTGEWNPGWPICDRYDQAMANRDAKQKGASDGK